MLCALAAAVRVLFSSVTFENCDGSGPKFLLRVGSQIHLMSVSRCTVQQISNVVNLCEYLLVFYRHFNTVYDTLHGHDLLT